jgi:4-alpha-glucanotransferase
VSDPPAAPAPVPARERHAGILLHPTSLPGRFAVGDLGPAAHAFLDWLAAAGLSHWQILPLGPTGLGDSPYNALSTFAGNPVLISPELLAQEGLVTQDDLRSGDAPPAPAAELRAAREFKQKIHRKGWDRFRAEAPAELVRAWDAFRTGDWATLGLPVSATAPAPAGRPAGADDRASAAEPSTAATFDLPSLAGKLPRTDATSTTWLADWALYAALKGKFEGRSWLAWDEPLRRRQPAALAAARRELAAEIEFRVFEQFLFFRQWARLRAAADARGIRILGDLPIYVAADSADVWANPELFRLGRTGALRAVAGVPPDYFSASGQRWGNPLYRWDRLASRGYDWWIARVGHQLRLVHALRLDHFRGFVAYWEVPAAAATAEKGRWVPGPGRALFDALRGALGGLPLVAEDLGQIDESVHALRRELGLPGMRVLQFGIADPESLHAPHQVPADAVAYTGTHDNDTSRGWLASANPDDRKRALTYLGADEAGFAWAMVRAAFTSAAELAIVPLQDAIGLGSEARMNVPGRDGGNWTWRVETSKVPGDLPQRLRDLATAAGRRPPTPPPPPSIESLSGPEPSEAS